MGESFVVLRISEFADIAEVLLIVNYPGEFGIYFCESAAHQLLYGVKLCSHVYGYCCCLLLPSVSYILDLCCCLVEEASARGFL